MTNLEFIILKNKVHAARIDVEDLKPYLEGLDVVSVELDFCAESLAQTFERYVSNRLDGVNNAELRAFHGVINDPKKPMSGFFGTLIDYLIDIKMPLVILERVRDSESKILNRQANPEMKLDSSRLFQGDLRYVCSTIMEHYQEIDIKRRLTRDRLMGQNSSKILTRIVELYPHLGDKENVQYGVIVGESHFPEVYIGEAGFKVNSINIPTSRQIMQYNCSEMMGVMQREGKGPDDLADILAARALIIALSVVNTTKDDELDCIERQVVGKVTHAGVRNLYTQLSKLPFDPDGCVSEAQQNLVINYVNNFL